MPPTNVRTIWCHPPTAGADPRGKRCHPPTQGAGAKAGHRNLRDSVPPTNVRTIWCHPPTQGAGVKAGHRNLGDSVPPTNVRTIWCHPPTRGEDPGGNGATHQHRAPGRRRGIEIAGVRCHPPTSGPLGASHRLRVRIPGGNDATHQHRAPGRRRAFRALARWVKAGCRCVLEARLNKGRG